MPIKGLGLRRCNTCSLGWTSAVVAPARFRQMIVEGFRHQPQSPHEKGWIGAIADPEVMVASWFRNLFERSSFVASGKARQLHRAFGALYSALAVTSKTDT